MSNSLCISWPQTGENCRAFSHGGKQPKIWEGDDQTVLIYHQWIAIGNDYVLGRFAVGLVSSPFYESTSGISYSWNFKWQIDCPNHRVAFCELVMTTSVTFHPLPMVQRKMRQDCKGKLFSWMNPFSASMIALEDSYVWLHHGHNHGDTYNSWTHNHQIVWTCLVICHIHTHIYIYVYLYTPIFTHSKHTYLNHAPQ